MHGTAANAVALVAGETAIFNFDLSAHTPLTYIQRANVFSNFSDPYNFSYDGRCYTGLNATGTSEECTGTYGNFFTSEYLDGLFSYSITVLNGGVSVDSNVTGYRDDQVQGTVAGTLYVPTPTAEPTSVPEPMTLGLMGLGLAGVALARRRRA